jgi:sugar lactone lactonase YvrE
LIQYEYISGAVTILASHVSANSAIDPGTPITYANDLSIAADGTIYFTSCTGG